MSLPAREQQADEATRQGTEFFSENGRGAWREQQKQSPSRIQATAGETLPLITAIGLVSGEVLLFLEREGKCSLQRLLRELNRPATWILMAIGALVRQGLLYGSQQESGILLLVPEGPSSKTNGMEVLDKSA